MRSIFELDHTETLFHQIVKYLNLRDASDVRVNGDLLVLSNIPFYGQTCGPILPKPRDIQGGKNAFLLLHIHRHLPMHVTFCQKTELASPRYLPSSFCTCCSLSAVFIGQESCTRVKERLWQALLTFCCSR